MLFHKLKTLGLAGLLAIGLIGAGAFATSSGGTPSERPDGGQPSAPAIDAASDAFQTEPLVEDLASSGEERSDPFADPPKSDPQAATPFPGFPEEAADDPARSLDPGRASQPPEDSAPEPAAEPEPLADEKTKPDEPVRKELAGIWQVVSKQVGNQREIRPEGQVTVIEPARGVGENGRILERQDPAQFTLFSLSTSDYPSWIALTPNFGPNFRKEFLGLYAREGDWLTLVFARPGAERPTSLTTPSEPNGSEIYRVTLRYLGPPVAFLSDAHADITPPWDEIVHDDDREAIQGHWSLSLIGGTANDQKRTIPVPPGRHEATITANKFPLFALSDQVDPLNDPEIHELNPESYKLDTSQDPKAIDFTVLYGPTEGVLFQGIYKLEGDSLVLCYSEGKGRPREFLTEAPGETLLMLRRQPESRPPTAATIRGPGNPPRLESDDPLQADFPPVTTHRPRGQNAAPSPRPESSPPETGNAPKVEERPAESGAKTLGPTPASIVERRQAIEANLKRLDAEKERLQREIQSLAAVVTPLESRVKVPETTPPITEEQRQKLMAELTRARIEEERTQDEIGDLRDRLRTLNERILELDIEEAKRTGLPPQAKLARMSQETTRRALDDVMKKTVEALAQARARLQNTQRLVSRLEGQLQAPSAELRKVRPGDHLRIDVLEALPGRPITGVRLVHPDGSISLDFHGTLAVAGLNREQIKVKLIEHLRRFLSDEALGLVGMDAQGRVMNIDPADSDRVYVDDAPSLETDRPDHPRSETLERRLLRSLLFPPAAPSASSKSK